MWIKYDMIKYQSLKNEIEAVGKKINPDLVRPRIKLSSCLETFIRSEVVEQFYSSALGEKTTAHK